MKALKLYDPGDIRVGETDLPVIKEGEVLVKVMACGVCGSDIPRVLHYGAYRKGLTVGHEFSGIIAETKDTSGKWQTGQRVVAAPLIPCFQCEWCQKGHYSLCEDYNYLGSRCDGAMAEYVAVPVDNLLELPEDVPFEAGAMVDPAANAIHGVWKAKINQGDTVAVYGMGPIGLFAVQYAKICGAGKVIGIDIMDDKLELAQNAEADMVINGIKEDPVAAINKQFGGAQVILDTSGSKIAQNQAVLSAAKHGRISFVGISHDSLALSKEAVNNILRRELMIHGSWNSFSAPYPGDEWRLSIQYMQEGKFWDKSFISHRLTLDEGPEIFDRLNDKSFYFSKIMFFPQEG